MQRDIIITKDGSHSIHVPEMNVTYHSHHGALQESMHVFIEAGLKHFLKRNTSLSPIHIFEMGLGTGLNALLTLSIAEKLQQKIYYEAIELYPLEKSFAYSLNYCEQGSIQHLQSSFLQLHDCAWNETIEINPYFTFKKINDSLLNYSTHQPINIIYYDAFAPTAQPELWTTIIFAKLYQLMAAKGTLVTYCSKGDVRRSLLEAGFSVEKIPGPLGKREMLRSVVG